MQIKKFMDNIIKPFKWKGNFFAFEYSNDPNKIIESYPIDMNKSI